MRQKTDPTAVSQRLTQIQELQNEVNSVSDARDFYDPETASSSGAHHVPSQPSTISSHRTMPSRDCRMIHGILWLLQETFLNDCRVAGWPCAPFVTQNSEWPPFRCLSGRNGPLWEVRGIEISMREPDFEPSSWFEPPLFCWAQNHQSWSEQKSDETPSGWTKNACCLIHLASRICFSPGEKCTSTKWRFFQNFDLPYFCTVFSTICGTVVEENEENTGGSKLGFWDPWPILRLRRSKFRFGACVPIQQVLPRFVCLWCRQCLWRVPWSQMRC